MARVDGGPESLLRIDERRRLLGQPPLGPMLLTADAQRAGLPAPVVTVTDSPVARETDYGRVDDHSSAIRAPGDARNTFNRVMDYPAGGADVVYGRWPGGRVSVSSSAADSTALPYVSPATGAAAAIDGDPATSWVSNSLQSAVGQWLQVDFDRPITNAAVTITPSATAVGAQVRRIEVSTANGTSTLRFDAAGKPLTAALPDRRDAVGAVHRRRAPTTVRPACSSASPTSPSRSTTPPVSPSRSACVTPSTCRARRRVPPSRNGISVGAARPPRLRGRTRRGAVCGDDGADARGAGQPEPHADGAGGRRGDADGVGAGATGSQPGRSDRPARHHPRRRRCRSHRRARLGLRGQRRRSAHLVDRATEHRAAPDRRQSDHEAACAHGGRRAAADAEHGRSCPRTRRWSPSISATAPRSAPSTPTVRRPSSSNPASPTPSSCRSSTGAT